MSDSIVDKLAEAANIAGERIKETFAGDQEEASRAMRGDEGRDKDRTQTSASEDYHDLASAAERKTNETIDRAKEVTQDVSQRADDTYKSTKGLVADESEKVKNAAEDIRTTAAEKAPGRDTQDPRVTSETGRSAGFETARDMSEKVEDV
ncbi:hypothetical protein PLESTB_001245300 [Pleodorina starrii]|uniref:Uncharacterized protein n=1 Tax=Pleodorina starrii TaxID=330485 RepID=A0A9W6BTH4_9CHLO|nr:hypothetical protein PLESTM_000214500 [Pleodorina starrii]GLC57605.1 hypothetical protein PLESTB_001245300 [Pleodorina starrii]GLC63275.1 hypothetical protein PLESTF_000019100 [Pleodorina starrii]